MKILYQFLMWLLGFPLEAKKEPQPQVPDDFMNRPLLRVGDEYISLGEACSGILVTGATGSGKSSSVGLQMILNLLENGLGGLVMSCKADEVENWRRVAKHCGREDDLIIFGRDGQHRFNWLDYESSSPSGAGLTENVVTLLLAVLSAENKPGNEQGYWVNAQKQLIRQCVELLQMAGEKVTVANMLKLVNSAAKYPDQVYDSEFREKSYCFSCLTKIEGDSRKERDKSSCADFWLEEYPSLADRTRSVIVSSLTGVLDVMSRGLLADLLGTDTTFTPEDSFDGKIIVLALDLHTYKSIGTIQQILFKMIWTRATERRTIRQATKPVFLWADEGQMYYIKEGKHDMLYQTTCRSLRVICVYLTQSIDNFLALVGQSQEAEIHSFIANLRSKVFLANSSIRNNRFSADAIGQTEQWKLSISADGQSGKGSYSLGQQWLHDLPMIELQMLRMGGPQNDFIVEGYVLSPGRVWKASGKNYVKASFKQVQLA